MLRGVTDKAKLVASTGWLVVERILEVNPLIRRKRIKTEKKTF